MDQRELEQLAERFEREVRRRFPDVPIERVEVLRHGDSPEIEPGELLGRVVLAGPEGGPPERERFFQAFREAHRPAIRELRHDLDTLPGTSTLEFVLAGDSDEKSSMGIRMRRDPGRLEVTQLAPVMARLGPEELDTVDTLITAGVAANRAEAIRWALARIRDRPAFEELRRHAREIEELKHQF
ncbi:MAG TPA: hypothetical protein VMD59_00185 [Acidimicrobiales bacterium]|nr:hypothetical protein [Acidimicrobiales bacterium]